MLHCRDVMNNNVAALIEEHRVLADLIALEYLNIPRCQLDDVRSEACLALLHAAEGFDSRMGEFPAYASRAIRNRLNSLYAKQIRLAKMFPMSIDEAGSSSSQTSGDRALKVTDSSALSDAKGDVLRDLRQRETCAILGTVLKELSPRERIFIEAIQDLALLVLDSAFKTRAKLMERYAQASPPPDEEYEERWLRDKLRDEIEKFEEQQELGVLLEPQAAIVASVLFHAELLLGAADAIRQGTRDEVLAQLFVEFACFDSPTDHQQLKLTTLVRLIPEVIPLWEWSSAASVATVDFDSRLLSQCVFELRGHGVIEMLLPLLVSCAIKVNTEPLGRYATRGLADPVHGASSGGDQSGSSDDDSSKDHAITNRRL